MLKNQKLLSLHHHLETAFLHITMFCKSLTDKYDLLILSHSKSLKKCRKNFENQFTNKTLKPKNNLTRAIYIVKMYKRGT